MHVREGFFVLVFWRLMRFARFDYFKVVLCSQEVLRYYPVVTLDICAKKRVIGPRCFIHRGCVWVVGLGPVTLPQ